MTALEFKESIPKASTMGEKIKNGISDFAGKIIIAVIGGTVAAASVLWARAESEGMYREKVDRIERVVLPRVEKKVDDLRMEFDKHQKEQAAVQAELKTTVVELKEVVRDLREQNRRK